MAANSEMSRRNLIFFQIVPTTHKGFTKMIRGVVVQLTFEPKEPKSSVLKVNPYDKEFQIFSPQSTHAYPVQGRVR